jgi:hypothetical protein
MYFLKIANLLNIPFLTGFCFWNDIINCSNPDFNINMLNNNLEKSENFQKIVNNSYTYVSSKFVNDVINKVFNDNDDDNDSCKNIILLDEIETISLEEEFKINPDEHIKYYLSESNSTDN